MAQKGETCSVVLNVLEVAYRYSIRLFKNRCKLVLELNIDI